MEKRNFGAVFALNVFLGWTVIGWIVAMCWGLMNDAPAQQVVIQQPTAPTGMPTAIFCSGCGKYSQAGALFCSTCGQSLIAPRALHPSFACISCGKPALIGSQLCGACGGRGRVIAET
jgi:hypothetical protein